ncbi:MAG: manganese-dependent inorganic pyrophosphatase [Paracoccaceae bacterium]
MTIKVLGHSAPDTDSTGSPIIWAWYLTHVRLTPASAVLLGEPNSEAAFVLEHWQLPCPEIIDDVAPGEDVVIVDTNNVAELPASINDANVLQIIDHHMLQGGLKTRSPIDITIRPLACTATIMFQLMGDDGAKMPDAIKGVMLSCIVSDTLEFRSPTTTETDKQVAVGLASDLGIDIPKYAARMFAAKSDVSSFSDAQLLRMDSKVYETDNMKFRVSVLETTTPGTILERKVALMAAMDDVATQDEVDQVLLFVVDILNQASTLLIQNDSVRAIAAKSFDVKVSGDTVVLPGIVSRKKQIIPHLKV